MPQLVHTLKSLSSVALLAVVKKGRPLVPRVSPEPRRLDHAAALRCGHLLILAGEIVLADRPADLLEHFGRLARGVQGLALLAAEGLLPEHPLELVQLVVIRDRRQTRHLPRLLRRAIRLQPKARPVRPPESIEGRPNSGLAS